MANSKYSFSIENTEQFFNLVYIHVKVLYCIVKYFHFIVNYKVNYLTMPPEGLFLWK